ncbi:actin-like ATPase domain-containing protein [Xylariomycetidae sp. FL2044]|nr:actin-like ATPase domain-containing protein [Xylariomycetidae sp. FL2044]
MSSSATSTLPHRAVASIRSGGHGISASPHTPSRPISSVLGSPSSLRADDDPIIIELGSRKLRIGYAGDFAPKRIVSFGPEQQRRVGDFRAWDSTYPSNWRQRASGKPWGADHELWQLDVRGQDLALVGYKLERELREAFTTYLLIDSKPRKLTLVLPPTIPIPLLSCVLDTIFNRLQAPSVSLLSSPVMATMAAGARSGLVIDIGWHETTVTAVYEYREVQSWRTVRAGKLLVEETYEVLTHFVQGRLSTARTERPEDRLQDHAVSFGECEEVATRMLWCKRAAKSPVQDASDGLPTVHEHEETETVHPEEDESPMAITLNSCKPPKTVEIPFTQLAEPCEVAFFETRLSPSCFDDHELPIHLLVYRALLQLPLDVRAVCMARMIFTGGCSNIIGIKGRIYDEVSVLAQERGWDPVRGKGVDQYKTNPKLKRGGSRVGDAGPVPVVVQPMSSGVSEGEGTGAGAVQNPAFAPPEVDPVEDLIKKEKEYKAPVQGTLRVLDSLGPWCGASLAGQIKVPAMANVDRDLWLMHGVNGASRPNEVDHKLQQRQSMGAGGLMKGQGSQPNNWTLGVWGVI